MQVTLHELQRVEGAASIDNVSREQRVGHLEPLSRVGHKRRDLLRHGGALERRWRRGAGGRRARVRRHRGRNRR